MPHGIHTVDSQKHVRLDFEVCSSNPLFNYTLRSNDVRLDFEVRSSNPPAPMLQATGLFKERITHNEMEGFLLGRFR